jgi:hypothetical protein
MIDVMGLLQFVIHQQQQLVSNAPEILTVMKLSQEKPAAIKSVFVAYLLGL